MTSIERVPGRSGLLEKLLASVRAEFRNEIYHPAPDDAVFVTGECAVSGCDRVLEQRGLCNGHAIRWRRRGRPDMAEFLADPGGRSGAVPSWPNAPSPAADSG